MVIQERQRSTWKELEEKIEAGVAVSEGEALRLYHEASLWDLSLLATRMRRKINGDIGYYKQNIHLEPTNICQLHCRFCSYRRNEGDPDSWFLNSEDIEHRLQRISRLPISEIHIVGGIHPTFDLRWFRQTLGMVRHYLPKVHIKAFTAVEIDALCKKEKISPREALKELKEAGLDSLPGGGAEIFDEKIRRKICGGKTSSERWLEFHREAHLLGMPSNATMLYGLYEDYEHRVDHMARLRRLQEETKGFDTFIPLKFKRYGNVFSDVEEVSVVEDLRNFAVARIFLHSIPHLKAYWAMLGRETAQMAMLFGADDLDGTIYNSTKIYSMAGAEEQKPSMTVEELQNLISSAGFVPKEKIDSLQTTTLSLPQQLFKRVPPLS